MDLCAQNLQSFTKSEAWCSLLGVLIAVTIEKSRDITEHDPVVYIGPRMMLVQYEQPGFLLGHS